MPSKIRKIIQNPPDNVIFPGFVSEEILLGAYSKANLFFFPSYEENEGIVVLEALSIKCPVIIRNIPVYENWLINNENCFKGNSNEEFIKIIKEAINQDNKSIIENGRKVAKERDLNVIGEKLKNVYESLL